MSRYFLGEGLKKPRGVLARPLWQSAILRLARPASVAGYRLLQRTHESRRAPEVAKRAKCQLRPYEHRVYSQQGEDGIIRELFYRIGSGGKYFVEFGVEDGSVCNTALLAHHYGWCGTYIEGDARSAELLGARWRSHERVQVKQAYLTANNVNQVFMSMKVPAEFDLLSIDIDGNDYWVWKALAIYRPRVVVIEYNAAYVPPERWIMAYDPDHRWDGTTHFGASLAAMHALGLRLGYALLGTESRGLNAFFLRRDLLRASGLQEATAIEAYHPPRYGVLRLRFPYRQGPFVTEG